MNELELHERALRDAADIQRFQATIQDLLTYLHTAESERERLREQLVVCRIRCERAEKQLAQEQRRRDREARR
jgi:hypothetical protein